MNDKTCHPRFFRIIALVIAALYMCLVWYFDWSDRYIHTFLALCLVFSAFRLPRLSIAALGLMVSLFALGHWAYPVPKWASELRPGDSWPVVVAQLGDPTYEVHSFHEARQLTVGYSLPSKLRFRHSGDVAVYLKDEYVLWIWHDGDRVLDLFVGGS